MQKNAKIVLTFGRGYAKIVLYLKRAHKPRPHVCGLLNRIKAALLMIAETRRYVKALFTLQAGTKVEVRA